MPADINASSIAAKGPALAAAAIKRASATTGAQFDYLMKTAMRESSLNADARAATSSAAGLFQFIEQTWLGVVKSYGAKHGLEDAAADIVRGENGTFVVAGDARREEILNLRFDPDASAALAGELAAENGRYLVERLGRAANATDLYLAHFLGAGGAAALLAAPADARAAEISPAAANANRNVFYDGARARTVGEVIASVRASMGDPDAAEPITQAPSATPPAATPAQRAVPVSGEYGQSSAAPSRLSLMAIHVLQALDPTRLMSRSNDDGAR